MNIVALIGVAFLIEAIVDGIKGALSKWAWVALGFGAVLGGLSGLDIFEMAGIPLKIPYVGAVLTGLIAGRGSSALYDLWDKLKLIKE